MFLFTTPTPRETAPRTGAAGSPVVEAIRQGAEKTGIGFDYLLATAKRESGLDPAARAGTSSATGLFQFIEQTWLGVLKQDGAELGLGAYAEAITARPQGGYTVSDPAARQAILDLRQDPQAAAAMAGALTRRNHEALSAELGREPTAGDLYAAHVLGTRGAAALIRSAQFTPARAAAADLPEAAGANRSIFYDRAGRARGSAEVYALLATSQAAAPPPASAAAAAAEGPTAYTAEAGSGLRSLFQTDARRGPISDGVARLWRSRSADGGAGAQAAGGPGYFPRSDGVEAAAVVAEAGAATAIAAPARVAATPAMTSAPLPPARPAEFGGAGRAVPLDLAAYRPPAARR
ncbi:MAG: lytic transglycosylase domain-containing protein [Methylobacterium frigidaeris]